MVYDFGPVARVMAHTSSFTPPITGANESTCPCLTYDVTMEQSTAAARRLSREGQFFEIMIKIVPSGLATNPPLTWCRLPAGHKASRLKRVVRVSEWVGGLKDVRTVGVDGTLFF